MAEAKRVDLAWRAEDLTFQAFSLVNSSSVICAFFSLSVFLLSDAWPPLPGLCLLPHMVCTPATVLLLSLLKYKFQAPSTSQWVQGPNLNISLETFCTYRYESEFYWGGRFANQVDQLSGGWGRNVVTQVCGRFF